MADDVLIKVEGVTKRYEGHAVLDELSFEVRRGETVVIMGQSGSGKSTLLRLMVAAESPDAGRISLFGRDITAVGGGELDELRKRFGILFQSGALYSSMTVGQNVALPIIEHAKLHPNVVEIMVRLKLEQVGLAGVEDLMPAHLSGGMRKRVGLARAIALDPEILFYDEPTAGLDPIMAGGIDQLIDDMGSKLGVTNVVVTHDMDSAFRIASRILLLYQGKFVAEGTPEELKATEDPFAKQFISGAPDGPVPLRRDSVSILDVPLGGGAAAGSRPGRVWEWVALGLVALGGAVLAGWLLVWFRS
jgi:phospholipid/cholesterol/gamma-HCH transport system ATP-binding protein